jgi:PleD family two-component response regulator
MPFEGKLKLLLVDESTTMHIMEEMMFGQEFDVFKATSGAEALKLAAEHRPDAILLDIVMGDMDGLETCRLLRNVPATKTTPIIMVTTGSEHRLVELAFSSGATDLVTKPIDPKVLRDKIAR